MFEESVSMWASMNSWFTPTVLFLFLNVMIGTMIITSKLTAQKPSEQQRQQDPQQPPHHHQLARSPSVLQRLKSNFYSHRSQEPSSIFAQNPALDAHFASHYTHQEHEHGHEQQPPPQLTRSPSMLQRLKSINFYNYLSQEPTATVDKIKEEDIQYTPQQERNEEPAEEEAEQIEEVKEEEEEEEEEEDVEHIQDQGQTLDEIYGQLMSNHISTTKSDTQPTSGEMPKKLPKKMKKSASSKSAFSHFEERDVVEARRPATVRESKARAAEMDDDEVDAKADDFINKFKHQLKLQRLDSILRYKETVNRTGK